MVDPKMDSTPIVGVAIYIDHNNNTVVQPIQLAKRRPTAEDLVNLGSALVSQGIANIVSDNLVVKLNMISRQRSHVDNPGPETP